MRKKESSAIPLVLGHFFFIPSNYPVVKQKSLNCGNRVTKPTTNSTKRGKKYRQTEGKTPEKQSKKNKRLNCEFIYI